MRLTASRFSCIASRVDTKYRPLSLGDFTIVATLDLLFVDAQHNVDPPIFPYLQGFSMESTTGHGVLHEMRRRGPYFHAATKIWQCRQAFLTALQQLMHNIAGVVASYFFINRNFCLLRSAC